MAKTRGGAGRAAKKAKVGKSAESYTHPDKTSPIRPDDSVWDHLAGTISAPFKAGERRQIAVKVIDDRGNEPLVVTAL